MDIMNVLLFFKCHSVYIPCKNILTWAKTSKYQYKVKNAIDPINDSGYPRNLSPKGTHQKFNVWLILQICQWYSYHAFTSKVNVSNLVTCLNWTPRVRDSGPLSRPTWIECMFVLTMSQCPPGEGTSVQDLLSPSENRHFSNWKLV